MGTVKNPGRFPFSMKWGSGKNPFQHREGLVRRIKELKGQGESNKEIADELGIEEAQVREIGS